MADRMAFPNTMKEFIESFSFKDSEEVYTNGAELIPVFRVEQGFEHYAKEIRAKAIDEFAEKIQWEYLNGCGIKQSEIDFLIAVSSRVAEQLKAGGENG